MPKGARTRNGKLSLDALLVFASSTNGMALSTAQRIASLLRGSMALLDELRFMLRRREYSKRSGLTHVFLVEVLQSGCCGVERVEEGEVFCWSSLISFC